MPPPPPRLGRAEWVVLGCLLLCPAVQYWLDKLLNAGDENQRAKAINRLLVDVAEWPYALARQVSLRQLLFPFSSLLRKLRSVGSNMVDPSAVLSSGGECVAVEVINHRGARVGNFAHSTEIRSPRPEAVKYRVGQVVVHAELGLRGVIVGWDPFAKAPETWLHEHHRNDWRDQPNYAVLVDERDRHGHQTLYVPEESIIGVESKSSKIKHPDLDSYFSHFDGAQYLPRPWLRVLYPHD